MGRIIDGVRNRIQFRQWYDEHLPPFTAIIGRWAQAYFRYPDA